MNKSKITLLVLLTTFISFTSCSDDDNNPSSNNTIPTIENQLFSIPNNASIGTSVGIVPASDEDNDDLSFSITSGNDDNVFSIDYRGIIFVEGQVNLDSYELTVQVADNFGNAEATVTVDVFEVNVTGLPPVVPPLLDGSLVGADYWSEEAKILSAGVGFCDIVGVPTNELTQQVVQQAGGAW